ncbi:MAG TPA: AAA family ATPase [Actinomycetes bacterium]|jgi:SpoVK/Ycf46/Vps4 family AAA+-type ATPase|nr:AAA family ATPase [Actinomycetes bacterium]
MPVDPELLAGLRAAVEAVPDNLALRLHVANLLLEAGRPAESLEHSSAVLALVPGQREAAELADRATAALPATPFPVATPFPAAAPAEPQHRGATMEQWVLGEVEEPRTTLADVGGMPAIKRWLSTAFLSSLRDPRMSRLFGRSLRGGLLMYGPPGCGKTFLARALAGELQAGFLRIDLAHVVDMWLGYSRRSVHEIFETARASAPCLLFLDQLDAIGPRRAGRRHSIGRGVVDQLVAELYSASEEHEGVFVVAATEHPWDVDALLRRPGRLDHRLLVLPPDLQAREAIIRSVLDGRPLAEDLDVAALAARTDKYSAADLARLCEAAAAAALEASIVSNSSRPITWADFTRGLNEIRPSTPPWFDLARDYARFAAEPGSYDDLVTYLRANG